MSTEEQKRKNREKQARFQARHPSYRRDRNAKKAKLHPKFVFTGRYRTFELCDPLDPEKLPRVVAYCKAAVKPIWANLWAVRHHSRSYWAQWFCKLEELELEPEERETPWNVGVTFPVPRLVVRFAVRSRIRHINTLITGGERHAPNWMLRNFEVFVSVKQPVGCIKPSGEVLHFNSIREAARIMKVNYDWISSAASEIRVSNKCLWFDD